MKVDQNENTYISQKCGRSKMHLNENDDVKTCNSIVFERFSVDSRKRIRKVVWTRIDRCVSDDRENAYF